MLAWLKPPCMQYRERIRGERPVPGSPTGKLIEGLEEGSDNRQLKGQPLLSLWTLRGNVAFPRQVWGGMLLLSPHLSESLGHSGHLSSFLGSGHPKASSIKEFPHSSRAEMIFPLKLKISLWSCYKSNPHNSFWWNKHNSYISDKTLSSHFSDTRFEGSLCY